MQVKNLINSTTMGEPKRLRPMIIWTILEYAFRGAPYGILIMAVWKFFEPLENPGTPLDTKGLFLLCGGLLIALILLFIVSRKSYDASYPTAYRICGDGRVKISEHIRKLSMGYFNSHDPGDVGSHLVSDFANVEQAIGHFVPQFYGAAVMPIILLTFLAFVDLRLALIAALVIPIALPFSWISTKIITKMGVKQRKTQVSASSRMIEYIQGIRLIKAYNLCSSKFDRLEKTFRKLKKESIKLEASAGPTMLLSSIILNTGFSIVIMFGLKFLLAGDMSMSKYLLFVVIGSRIYEPIFQALVMKAEMSYSTVSAGRIEELRNKAEQTGSNPFLTADNYEIEFNNVSFRYHNTDVLKNIDLKIPEKSLTALVGPSGSGKTTMTRLIARFWDVNNGHIYIGGNKLTNFEPANLLKSISMVFQDVYLFNDTIYNNIAIGNKSASKDEVIKAAEKARCHEFINALPNQYGTMVGEGGSTLSGGERQRISIARAILKDAPVILLDEATASLDPENELHIQGAINDLVKDKTVVVIAHRLNTIAGADNIVVLNEGSVIEQGNHKELLNQNGMYKKMWDEQRIARGWKF